MSWQPVKWTPLIDISVIKVVAEMPTSWNRTCLSDCEIYKTKTRHSLTILGRSLLTATHRGRRCANQMVSNLRDDLSLNTNNRMNPKSCIRLCSHDNFSCVFWGRIHVSSTTFTWNLPTNHVLFISMGKTGCSLYGDLKYTFKEVICHLFDVYSK